MTEFKITILTPSFNQGAYIEKTINSVLNQNIDNIEHIVIDGGSTDGTIEILRKYSHLKWVSEPDKGQSDALNKGLAMATGDIIGWINSDDFYEENIFSDVASHFEDPNTDWIVGNTIDYFDSLGFQRIVVSPAITYYNLMRSPSITRQPGTFHRKTLLVDSGGWDVNFHMCMDYELWVRLAKHSTPKMVNRTYTYFRIHRGQKTTPKNKIYNITENERVLRREGISWLMRKMIFLKDYRSIAKYIIKMMLIKIGIIDRKYENVKLSMRKIV